MNVRIAVIHFFYSPFSTTSTLPPRSTQNRINNISQTFLTTSYNHNPSDQPSSSTNSSCSRLHAFHPTLTPSHPPKITRKIPNAVTRKKNKTPSENSPNRHYIRPFLPSLRSHPAPMTTTASSNSSLPPSLSLPTQNPHRSLPHPPQVSPTTKYTASLPRFLPSLSLSRYLSLSTQPLV